MTRQSYTPNKLDILKAKRNKYTINTNKTSEPYKHGAIVISRKGGGAVIGYGANTFNNEFELFFLGNRSKLGLIHFYIDPLHRQCR